MFEYTTSEPLNFLKITPSYNVAMNKKFSKNWLEYLEPSKFGGDADQPIDSDNEEESSESDQDEYKPIVSKSKYARK